MLADIKSRLSKIKELNKIIDGPISTKGEVTHREKQNIQDSYESDVEFVLAVLDKLVESYEKDLFGKNSGYMDNFKRDV